MAVTFVDELPEKISGGSRYFWDGVAEALVANADKWAEVQSKPKGTKSAASSAKSALRSRQTDDVTFEVTQRLVGDEITVYARAVIADKGRRPRKKA